MSERKPKPPQGCEHCIYKQCGKKGDDVRYCLIRILAMDMEERYGKK